MAHPTLGGNGHDGYSQRSLPRHCRDQAQLPADGSGGAGRSAVETIGITPVAGAVSFPRGSESQFLVYVERQRFVCFGCKSRGDVIDFVRLHEQLTTVGEACNWLTGTPAPTATLQG